MAIALSHCSCGHTRPRKLALVGRVLHFGVKPPSILNWLLQYKAVVAACADDAHRPLGKQHNLAAALSEVEQRVITNDYTFRHDNKILQILRADIKPRMRGCSLRVETRRNGDVAARFEDRYVRLKECQPAQKTSIAPRKAAAKSGAPEKSKPAKSKWMNGFFQRPAPSLEKAIKISNAHN